MNKADEQGRPSIIDEAKYKKTFPNIVSFHKVSCLTGEGINGLREEIERELTKLPHIKDKFPFTWKYIRDDLEVSNRNKNYINEEEYYEKCQT